MNRRLSLITLAMAALGQNAPLLPFADATPDTILRGQSTRVVVKGRDAASLHTLKVEPGDGVTIRAITPLSASSVSVEIAVEGDAKIGERQLMLTLAPTISRTPSVRESGLSQQPLEAFRDSIVKGNSTVMEAGSVYINSHAISITNVSVVANQNHRLIRITASDTRGDFAAQARPGIAPAAGIQLVTAPDWMVSEARCGKDVFDSPITDAVVASREGASATIVAQLSMEGLAASGPCELRVRVRDAAGNTSGWYTSRLR
ncbi:MAG: hypothetical protein HY820_34315 [Acidobacteria bacterium]|nr:hypothetical protein [Acidobacteriota bacterium]